MGIPTGHPDPSGGIQDVLIIGAGISGINAAYRFQQKFPDLKYTIVERRAALGGTWDLFRYPGIRSDSDLHTFAFQWWTWPHRETIAAGPLIKEYMNEAARGTGIDKHILFHHEVTRASWSTEKQMWTVTCLANGITETTLYARFAYWGSGYYNYKEPLVSPISGLENFKGTVVHPQFWPADLDYAGKNIVIIGSGATAITLLPALAKTAKKVTMVQRTPSYIATRPAIDPLTVSLRKWFPKWVSGFIVRLKFLLLPQIFYNWARKNPDKARAALKERTLAELPPDFPFAPHFVPPYKVWDQRLCFSPDGDFFQAIRDGKADIATGVIDTCTPAGIRLTSGQTLDDIDIIITATGVQAQMAGGAKIFVDGRETVPGHQFLWRGLMLQDVPNAGVSLGYANASWTLGADTSAVLFARVMKDVQRGGYSSVVPRLSAKYTQMQPSAAFLGTLSSTYVRLNGHHMPKVGDKGPWEARTGHFQELFKLMFSGHSEGLVFSRA